MIKNSMIKNGMVTCPDCGDDYTHIASVTVDQMGLLAKVEGTGVSVDSSGRGCGRGSKVSIDMYCECGTMFSIALNFNKGQTFIESEITGECGDDDKFLPALWRD